LHFGREAAQLLQGVMGSGRLLCGRTGPILIDVKALMCRKILQEWRAKDCRTTQAIESIGIHTDGMVIAAGEFIFDEACRDQATALE